MLSAPRTYLLATLVLLFVLNARCTEYTAEFAGKQAVVDTGSIGYVVGLLPEFGPLSLPSHGGYMVQMTSASGVIFDCLIPDKDAPLLEEQVEPEKPAPPQKLLVDLPVTLRNNNKFFPGCFTKSKGWWTYEVCPFQYVRQYHQEKQVISSIFDLGHYVQRPAIDETRGGSYIQTFEGGSDGRKAKVKFICNRIALKTLNDLEVRDLLSTVDEPKPLEYVLQIATDFACNMTEASNPPDTMRTLLSPLENQCMLLNRGWWTFRFCYLKEVTQFHAEQTTAKKADGAAGADATADKPTTTITAQYDLGHADEHLASEIVQGTSWDTSYVKQEYVMGSQCDVTGLPRRSTARFYCNPDTPEFALKYISEVQTCVYDVRVDTAFLCGHPAFAPNKLKIRGIVCTPQEPVADPS